MRLILAYLIAFAPLFSCCQQSTSSESNSTESQATDSPRVELHPRVDTSNPDVLAIVKLYSDYLLGNPETTAMSNLWSSDDRKRYPDFDLSRRFLFQIPSKQLFNYFSPRILAVEKDGPGYSIRTIFSARNQEAMNIADPWAIVKVFAIKEQDEWKLTNALPIITRAWMRQKVGNIEFVFPEYHVFNQVEAEMANRFVSDITRRFNLTPNVPFEFYITNSPDELGNLLNFEFFYAGYTSGVCLTDERLLLSGKGSPWYPHELVHMAAAGAKRHAMIEEGFATWLGGQNQMSWERSKFILKEEIAKNQEVTFNQVIEGTWGNQAAFYTSGALLCQAAFDKGGDPAVEQLLTAPTEDEAFKAFLCEFFNIPPAELSDFWRSEVMK